MLKTIIKLPDGTELSSGANHQNAIQRVTLTECVNSGENLILGSTCANALEATLFTPRGGLSLQAGTEVTVYKDDGNTKTKVGVFVLDKPTRPTANTFSVTGYDRVSKLDKDLTAWLSGLSEWPYSLNAFAIEVCKACGVPFKETDVPNKDFQIQKFTRTAVTGRQLMRWLGEICCSFCRADREGYIEFAWYSNREIEITPTGDRYYFQNGLTFENYEVAKVDAVQLRLADSENGALWPAAAEGVNSYIITGNPILNARITEELLPYLQVIQNRLSGAIYTPCKVEIPASMDIAAGDIIKITDKNGKSFNTWIMTKTQSGQKDTLESTGSARRDSTSAANNKSQQDRQAAMENYAGSAALNAVNNQTQEDLFKKLTDDGRIQGLFMKDGQMYVNVAYLAAGIIASADGTVKINLKDNYVTVDGSKDGYKTQIKLSSSGLQGYGENSSGKMEHVLSFDMGVGGKPMGLWNMSLEENRGLSVGAATGEFDLGTSEAVTAIYGSGIEFHSVMAGVVAEVLPDGLAILGKRISWKANGDGTFTLIGS